MPAARPATRRRFTGTPVLVTGASGFLGSHLARRLVGAGAEVHVLLRRGSETWRIADLRASVHTHFGDLTRIEEARRLVRRARPQVVFHVAGMRERQRDTDRIPSSLSGNLTGTVNLCLALLGHAPELRRYVHTGSGEEYGCGPVPFREEQREQPVSPYSAAKVAASHFCQMLHRSHGLPAVILRPSLLYGPAQDPDFFIPSLIQHCLSRRDPFPMTGGRQKRDLLHIEDCVEAFLLAAHEPGVLGEIVNISGGRGYTIREVARRIVAYTGGGVRLGVGALPERPSEVLRLVCANRKAKRLLGWAPNIDLERGLARTVEWYRREWYRHRQDGAATAPALQRRRRPL